MKQRLLLFTLLVMSFAVGLMGQITNATLYDFRDGSIIAAGQSLDGLVTLAGTYSHHGTTYGLNMKVDGDINVSVPGSGTMRFLGSQYSGLNMVGTATASGDLGTQNTQVVNDRVDVFDFTYSGNSADLNFHLVAGSGNDLYLPTLEVIPAQPGATATSAADNIVYYYDLRDGSIIPTNTTGQTDIHLGLIYVIVGPSNAYGYNGGQHGSVLKTGNRILLQVEGNARIRVGGSIFSNGTISASSATGAFDVASQSSTTSGNFGNDRSTVDFLYVGGAGTVALDFTGTNYIPYIEVVPVPYEVTLTPWVQKSGVITVNGVDISLATGEDASSNATVAVSAGNVISATDVLATLFIDLAGEELAFYTPSFTGDIDTVIVMSDTLVVRFNDDGSDPAGYLIKVGDNSQTVVAEPGATYMYNFADGSEMPQISYQALRYGTYISHDGILTINSNTDVAAGQFGYHDAQHGGVFFPGNSFDMIVAGDAIVTFFVDTYGSAEGATFVFTDPNGNAVGSVAAENIGGADGFPVNFSYSGPAGVLTATLTSADFPTAEVYLHGLNIENAPAEEPSNGKIDVWDFAADQLDPELHNNHLDEAAINAWYDPSITPGTSGIVLPSTISMGLLSWTGGGNDRLRTANTNLTRFDQNVSNAPGYAGRLYVNAGAAAGRFMSITLDADDELTLAMKTDAGGIINFQYVADPGAQTEVVPVTSDFAELTFVAQYDGAYRIFDTQGKPSYYRISRKDATYIDLTGAVDTTQAPGIPQDFQVVFTNAAGKAWRSGLSGGNYAVRVPAGFTYSLSLEGANGYIITGETELAVTESTTTYDIAVQRVELYTVTGAVVGLGTAIADLVLTYMPDPAVGAIYVPNPVIDVANATYSVSLEPNVEYTLSAAGVNDYFIPNNTITIGQADASANVVFVAKPLYNVAIDAQGLTAEQLDLLDLTFANRAESGYSYTFSDPATVSLRDGVYGISASGLDDFPVQLGPTSNLAVAGADASKVLAFGPVTYWPFDDRVIANGEPAYKGLLFSGVVFNEILKSHLVASPGAVVQVPVQPGQRVVVKYYYTADFAFDGGTSITTNTQSTSIIEQAQYDYSGAEPGFVTLSIGASVGTTYITDIYVVDPLPYTPVLTVGVNRDYQFINEAMAAIRRMDRDDDQRVTIMIDAGNYEEMVVVDEPSVTFKNAAANPNIEMANQGVDIAPNAVRITSYYGHGYSYYSMGNDQKWNADVLRVNRENGFLSYENRGAGTTNGSFWNATVVVTANDFVAEDIIFENSFNQYISRKETEDIVVQWPVGGRGERPIDLGNTAVQDRSFVERAAAIAVTNNVERVILYKSRVIGRQDSFFGGGGSRLVMYKGSAMGAVDYIFGGMTAVFYKTDLSMNTSDAANDQAYITAAQQGGGRGFLMYECNVTSAQPGTESASATRAKPGYFGRPWQATTSEVVFYNTNIETSDFPGFEGQSLIVPLGWQNSLGGESSGMYEYGTVEASGVDNSGQRAGWSTLLTEPTLADGEAITTFNFTKGTDGWDPLPGLIEQDLVSVRNVTPTSAVQVRAYSDRVYVSNVASSALVEVFSLNGTLHKSLVINGDKDFTLPNGLWVVYVTAADGRKTTKVFTHN